MGIFLLDVGGGRYGSDCTFDCVLAKVYHAENTYTYFINLSYVNILEFLAMSVNEYFSDRIYICIYERKRN